MTEQEICEALAEEMGIPVGVASALRCWAIEEDRKHKVRADWKNWWRIVRVLDCDDDFKRKGVLEAADSLFEKQKGYKRAISCLVCRKNPYDRLKWPVWMRLQMHKFKKSHP